MIDAFGSATTFECASASSARGAKILVFGVATISAVSNIRPYEIYARAHRDRFVNQSYTHERAVSLLPHIGLDRLQINTFSLLDFRQAFDAQSGGTPAKIELLPQA